MSGHIRRRVLPSGAVRYYAVARVGGRAKNLGGFARKKDAEARLRAASAELAEGTFGRPRSVTFSDLAERWLEDYASVKGLKPSTLKDYREVTRNHLAPFFSGPLEDITPDVVQSYVAEKIRAGYSPRTVSKTLAVLKSMMKKAEAWGYVQQNPTRFVELPQAPHREMDYLRPDEVARLLDAASPEYRALFAMAVLTGARQGELLALRWSDYDQARGVIYIRRSYHPEYGFSSPKSKRGVRAVPISPLLAEELEAHRPTGQKPSDLIYRNRAGKPVNFSNMIAREFHPALERAGLRRVRFHDLRHTYAALMISLNCNPKVLQERMGHASITTTLDRYGHLLPSVDQGIESRIDALIADNRVTHFRASRRK
jgi:integrase